jgi:DNA repair exonuclease SbcCD ATPase subunit
MAISADDVYKIMVAVNAQLEIILGREDPITRAELAEYSKVVKAQAAPVLDPLKLAQQLLPQLLAQLPKQLPLKVEPKTEEIVKLLSPVINQQVTAIQTTNERLLRGLTQHLTTLDATLTAQALDLKERDASFRGTTDRIPKEVKVDYVGGRLKLALLALGPMLALLVILKVSGAFSKDPIITFNETFKAYHEYKKSYEEYKSYSDNLEKQNQELRQVKSAQQKELNFYRNQVHQYRKKFPRSAPYLPPYLPAKK